MDAKEQKIIEETIEELLKMLQIDGSFTLQSEEETIHIQLDTPDSGMVIGYHGDMLESLQLVFSFCISKKIGRFVRVSLEVGDYKKNRTDWLHSLANQTKERVLLEQREIPLPELKSWERRIIHVYLQDDKDVLSESVGEGKTRTLVIKPR